LRNKHQRLVEEVQHKARALAEGCRTLALSMASAQNLRMWPVSPILGARFVPPPPRKTDAPSERIRQFA
jgi:hypothetical protein